MNNFKLDGIIAIQAISDGQIYPRLFTCKEEALKCLRLLGEKHYKIAEHLFINNERI